MSGAKLIAQERQRQIREEHWSRRHDREHDESELARAAACYALPAEYRKKISLMHLVWPGFWDFKPGPTRIRELVKAGALIAAEIDRLASEAETK